MKTVFTVSIATLLLATLAVSLGMAFPIVQAPQKNLPGKPAQEQVASEDDQFAPIEDMHHFMEYVCEPSYKGLKQVLATEPANRKAWKAFKNHALVLAETSALVAARGPDEPAKAKQWKEISREVYNSGSALYKSAGKYEDAKKHYGLMIDQCNKCHTVFAEGKHQLTK